MALAFKKGDKVRQVVNVIEGEVVDVAVIDSDVQFKVDYVDANGEAHSRFFTEAEIKALV